MGKGYAEEERLDKKGIFSLKFCNGQNLSLGFFHTSFFTLFPISFHISRQPMSQSNLKSTKAILFKSFLIPKVFHIPKQITLPHHNLKYNSIKPIILSILLIKALQRNESDSTKSCQYVNE